MKITLEGREDKIKLLLKSQRLWIKKKGIKVVNHKCASTVEINKAKLTANEVSELIAKCESIEDLKEYESDTRQVVCKAYDKKLKELSE